MIFNELGNKSQPIVILPHSELDTLKLKKFSDDLSKILLFEKPLFIKKKQIIISAIVLRSIFNMCI